MIAEEATEIIEKDKMDARAEKNKLYKFCLEVISSPIFSHFINLNIVVNTFVLALDRYPMNSDLE